MRTEGASKHKGIRFYLAMILLLQILILFVRIMFGLDLRSSVLILEGIHILVDISITVAVLISFRIIEGNYARQFSYGLYKLDDLISFIIAILVAYSAIEIVIGAIRPDFVYSFYPSLIQFITIIPLFLAGYLKIKTGKVLELQSLIEDGRHTYTDVYEGVSVGIGLALFYLFKSAVFYYFSIGIAVIAIMITSYSIGKNSLISLLDMPKDKEIVNKVREIIMSSKGIQSLKDLRLRWAGPVIFAEAVITVNSTLTIMEAHKIADNVEKAINDQVKEIRNISIHLEPSVGNRRAILIPTNGEKINDTVTRSKKFKLIIINDDRWEEKNILNEANARFQKKLYEICKDNEVTDLICLRAGDNTKAMLKGIGVRVWKTDESSIDDSVRKLLENKLEAI